MRFALSGNNQFAGESLWAQDVVDGVYRLCNVPFNVKGYAEGDLVRCVLRDGWREVIGIERDSGNGTLLVKFTDAVEVESQRRVLDEITPVGCSYERVTRDIVAFTVPETMDVPFSQLLNYLDEQLKRGVFSGWEVHKHPANSDCRP